MFASTGNETIQNAPEMTKGTNTMAYATAHSSRTIGLLSPIADVFAGLSAAWARSRVYTRTYNELNSLTTRELNDLGISRSMISRLAHEAAYGRDA